MKNLKNICLVLGLFPILIASAFATEVVQQQTYTSRVILSAPWGNQPGEFGINDPYSRDPKIVDAGPVQGPSTFTIAPNGDIYIVDIFNYRVQRFTQNGNFVSSLSARMGLVEDICVDANGNVYLLEIAPAYVRKLDSEGKLLKLIPMFNHNDPDAEGMNIGGGSTKLYYDNSGRLFLSYYKENERARVIFQFGTTTTEYSPPQQKASLRRGSAGMSGIILNKNQIFQWIEGKMFSVDASGKQVTGYEFAGPWNFLDVDGSGYVYMTSYNGDTDMYSVRKQTPDGKIISSFEWKYPRYQLPLSKGTLSVDTNKELMIDAQGNIYVLGLTNSGVTITKWSPSGGK